ncbi:MAG: DUF6209 family protein [Myxococcales bacterium]|jgi:hypothetical protein
MTESTVKTKRRAGTAQKASAKKPAAARSATKAAAPSSKKAPAATASGRKVATRKIAPTAPAAEGQPVARASVRFTETWNQTLEGELVAGGRLRIEYALERARAHGGRDDASAVWGVEAYVQFLPSGEIIHAPVVSFPARFGKPAGSALATPCEIAIPQGAYEAQVWFQNWSEGEQPRWDSNFGVNYRFPVRG